MSNIKTVKPESLPPVEWQGVRVITTDTLAKVYGTTAVRVRQNHERNRDRFIEGKHYYKVDGPDLQDLRVSLSDSQISAKARSLILWTERGAARHAKMLETDKAWDVFEALEDSYFARRAELKQESERSTVWDRYPLYGFTIETVLRHHILFSKVYLFLNIFAGTRRFKDMTKTQAKEVVEFCDRYAAGRDTSSDWRRIQANYTKLFGEQKQLDLVQILLTGDTRLLPG